MKTQRTQLPEHDMNSPRLARVGLFLALIAAAAPAAAQSPDSLVRQLGSSDWQQRANAIFLLNRIPIAELPPAFAPTAIALLEREATTPATPGEGYGEYEISLVEGVLRLKDPRSLRGMAILGIQVDREAENFVAAQGAAALPYLAEAWRDYPDARAAVAETWAAMLAEHAAMLEPAQRIRVLARVLDTRRPDPLAFAWAADRAALVSAIPLLEEIGARSKSRILRLRALEVAQRLGRVRGRRDARSLVSSLEDVRAALCLEAAGARAQGCSRLAASTRAAGERLGRNSSRGARAALRSLLDAAARAQGLSASERRLFRENASYLLARVPG